MIQVLQLRWFWLHAKGLECSDLDARHIAYLNAHWLWRTRTEQLSRRWALAFERMSGGPLASTVTIIPTDWRAA